MLRLSLLGGVTLRQDDNATDLADRGWRRSALLALLAASGRTGVVREQLLALLWPESETDRARHSLDELISRIRRESGARELFIGSQRVALNPECVQVDAWEFEEASVARQAERAMALYAGPFAEGARFDGQELEQRIEAARVRHARMAEDVVEHAAQAAQSRGDAASASRWWRRLVELDPLNERAICELVGAHAAVGETAQALRVARVHVLLVREQLDAEPGPRVSEWIERLQSGVRIDAIDATYSKSTEARRAAPRPMEVAGADRVLERAASIFGSRYRMASVVDDGSVLLRVRANIPAERMREVDFCFLQPLVASLVDAERFSEVFARACKVVDATILPVLDFGARDDLIYFVTSPLPRDTLRDALRRRGALSIAESVRTARAVARALSVAHRHGLSHGDLRPKHVASTATGDVLVANFGLVDTITRPPVDATGTTAIAFGSPRYLSPEQLDDGRRADARSDVFSFGVTVFHMLTGTVPAGRSFRRVQSGEWATELARYRPQTPPPLRDVVTRCLSPHPSDRYAQGDELVSALAEVAV